MSVSATLANVVGTVIVTGTVGALLTYFWHIRQKRREVTLAITSEFYKLYGEIIAVWKLWNHWYEKNNAKGDQSEVQDENGSCFNGQRSLRVVRRRYWLDWRPRDTYLHRISPSSAALGRPQKPYAKP
jgi:hypothetical protein